MQKPISSFDQRRLTTELIIRLNYSTSIILIAFAIFSYYGLQITKIIPQAFFLFGALNILNNLAFRKHNTISCTFNITTALSFTGSLIVTLYSGILHSPFIFVLALTVFSVYASKKSYARIYTILNIGLITFIFGINHFYTSFFTNVVPEGSQDWFSYLSILLCVYLFGNVFVKSLMHEHKSLFYSKRQIEQQIKEKEILLQEIHHRVKNNLQTVSSLLNMQSRSVKDEQALGLIKSSQNRVIAMAMIHEMLYMRDDISRVNFNEYVKQLSNYLIGSVRKDGNEIQLDIDIKDITFEIDTAIPLGLLINEAITNSIKYGFSKENSSPLIYIHLYQQETKEYMLHIGDNGIGYDATLVSEGKKSLGLSLIKNLTRQLKGSILHDQSQPGTNYIITFQESKQS